MFTYVPVSFLFSSEHGFAALSTNCVTKQISSLTSLTFIFLF